MSSATRSTSSPPGRRAGPHHIRRRPDRARAIPSAPRESPPAVPRTCDPHRGRIPETPKAAASSTTSSSAATATALAAARARAEGAAATASSTWARISKAKPGRWLSPLPAILRSIRHDGQPPPPPLCLLSGGETTVTLGDGHGRGRRIRNSFWPPPSSWAARACKTSVVLSGGTDGEDGPTDAAGAVADEGSLAQGRRSCSLDPRPVPDPARRLPLSGSHRRADQDRP